MRRRKIFVNPFVLLKGFLLAVIGRLAYTSLFIDTERSSLEIVVVPRSNGGILLSSCFDLREGE